MQFRDGSFVVPDSMMQIPRCNSEKGTYHDMKSKPPLSTPPIAAAPPKSIVNR